MNLIQQIDLYKSKIINLIIVILALFIVGNIYRGSVVKVEALKLKISAEEKKNDELEKISQVEKKISLYQKLLSKREQGLVMGDISVIAKGAKVNVLSIKPGKTESAADYSKNLFEVNVSASDYASLAKFIYAIESYDNVYIVESINIINQSAENKKNELTVNLFISSVAAKT